MKKFFFAAIVTAPLFFGACNNGSTKANLKTDIDTVSYEIGLMMAPTEAELQGYLVQNGSDSAYVEEFMKGFMEGIKSGDDKKQIAHDLGLQFGLQQKSQLPMIERQVFQGDSTKKVSIKNYVSGFTDFTKAKTKLKREGKLVDKEEANKHIMQFMFTKVKKESADFMAKKAKEAGVKKLANGILYKVVKESASTERVSATDSVKVKYEGKLANGTVFDSSNRMKDSIATLSLKNVIKGWQVAIPQMPVGSTWEIYIPYDQAYGEQGSGAIPPFSALIFTITLDGKAK